MQINQSKPTYELSYGIRTRGKVRYRGKSVHRAAARPQKEQLDGCSDAAVVAEPIADRGNVVLAQAEELFDIEFGHPGGKGLRANETLGERHGKILHRDGAANLLLRRALWLRIPGPPCKHAGTLGNNHDRVNLS